MGVDLSIYGIKTMVWNENQIIEVLCSINSKGTIVLGGDVYIFRNGRYIATGDSWFYNGEDIGESHEKALNFVKNYIERNCSCVWFGIVIKNQ